MKSCIVFAGGPKSDYDKVDLQVSPQDFLIACDAGYDAARYFGVTPHLAVGDFDSFAGEIDPAVKVHTAPAHKDDTDTLLGLRLGLERGYRSFTIIGGLGGRLDHTIANLQLLTFLCEQGAQGRMLANDHCVWAVRNGELTLPRMEGYYLSVFAWGGGCSGVTLSQVGYSLNDAELHPEFPIGVSNEFTEQDAILRVKQGTLLVIASAKK